MKYLKNPLLSVSIGIILIFTLLVFFATEASYEAIEIASIWVRNYFGFFYLYLGLGCVLFLLAIAFSPFGKIKLGKKDSKPEYSLWAWTAMLYSAGMGSGILYVLFKNLYLCNNIRPTNLVYNQKYWHWSLPFTNGDLQLGPFTAFLQWL